MGTPMYRNNFIEAHNPLRLLCDEYGCDLAIPSATGVGDILMYTTLVEEVAMRVGRPVNLLTGPMRPIDGVGTVNGEDSFPIWQANPFVGAIVDAEKCGASVIDRIHAEHENHCHFGHVIENICAQHGIVPRVLRPSLFLTEHECREALTLMSELPRPILCIHPYGTSSPDSAHPWYRHEWEQLIGALPEGISVLEVGIVEREDKGLATHRFRTTLRQMMALVWGSDFMMGFDSSVAHIATAFCKPALVLWEPVRKAAIDLTEQPGLGAAAISRWGYRENKNLILLQDTRGDIRRIAVEWITNQCRARRFP